MSNSGHLTPGHPRRPQFRDFCAARPNRRALGPPEGRHALNVRGRSKRLVHCAELAQLERPADGRSVKNPARRLMPLQLKVPGYLGNGLLLLLSVVMLSTGNAVIGLLLAALAALNLFLIFKLDQFSRPEAWLAHELEMTKLREELLAAQERVADLEMRAPRKDRPPEQGGTAAP
jgi:hypothetical protein